MGRDNWQVVRWMLWEGDNEPSAGVIYHGEEDGARRVFQRYADQGEEVELRHQPPPTVHPWMTLRSTRKSSALSPESNPEGQ